MTRLRLTQVGRALGQLGIEHIASYSPEARGRVERLFGTLQGRLPQELRLAGIATIEAANRYIAQSFLPAFNAQLRRLPPPKKARSSCPMSDARSEGHPRHPGNGRQVQNDNCGAL